MNLLLVFLNYFGRRLARVWWQVALITLIFCTPLDCASAFVESAFADIAETRKFMVIQMLGEGFIYLVFWSLILALVMLITRESELIQREFRKPHVLEDDLPGAPVTIATDPSNFSMAAWNLWRPRWGRLTRDALFFWPRVVATRLVETIFLSLGCVMLCVPGIFLFAKLAVMVPIVIRERIWGMAAVNLSFELSEGRYWKVFWLLILGYILVMTIFVPVLLGLGTLAYFFPVILEPQYWVIAPFFRFPLNLAILYFAVFVYCVYNFLLWDRANQLQPRPVEDFLDFDPDA